MSDGYNKTQGNNTITIFMRFQEKMFKITFFKSYITKYNGKLDLLFEKSIFIFKSREKDIKRALKFLN